MDKIYSLSGKRVFVAGGSGLAGSAVVRALKVRGDCDLLWPSRSELDLCDQRAVAAWFCAHKPDVVIMAAGCVGGIGANANEPADFMYQNNMMALNVINNSKLSNSDRLIYLGSSCIYPRDALMPLDPFSLMTGPLEQTNRSYAMAKLAGIEMCQSYRRQYGCDFISALPCNLYGIDDHFDEMRSHVIPAIMMRAHEAKASGQDELSIWGSGQPLREFLCADDLAQALLIMLEYYNGDVPVNIGASAEVSIAKLASLICEVVGYDGRLVFDDNKPDGVMSKIMDSRVINDLGWAVSTELRDGLQRMYDWYTDCYLPLRNVA